MTRKTLRGASFNSIDQLTQEINDFIAAYNDKAAPLSGASGKSKAPSCGILPLIYAIKH
jgi:hypothetical protein